MTDESKCPLEGLITEAQALIDAHDAADSAESDLTSDDSEAGRAASIRLRTQMDKVLEYLDGVKLRASFLKATSARGALFQLCLINDLAGDLDAYRSKGVTRDPHKAEAAIERMLHSVAGFIERESGQKIEDACGGYFMGRATSPHEVVASVLALRPSDKKEA